MTAISWMLLFAGAVIGAVVNSWYQTVTSHARSASARRRVDRRAREDKAGLLPRKLVRYYSARGLSGALYTPRHLGSRQPIALLVDDAYILSSPVSLSGDELLTLDGSAVDRFDVRPRLIRRREAQGARLFDGQILYLKRVDWRGGEPRLVTATCNYFSYATLSLRLEGELRRRWGGMPLRDSYLATAESALLEGPSEQLRAIGCSCVTALLGEDSHVIALQNRSSEVLNYNNVRVVVPTFGLEPNAVGSIRSQRGILFYNYLREFAEEFFSLDDVIYSGTARNASPDWIFQLPQIAALEKRVRSRQFTLECTGIAVNPLDGSINIAMLATSRSRSLLTELRSGAIANWEAAQGGSGGPAIEFVDLYDPQLDKWADDGTLGPSTIFALDRARERLSVS